MHLIKTYIRVIKLLKSDIRTAIILSVINLLLAGLQFIDPILFGHVIDMLTHSAELPHDTLVSQATGLMGLWIGAGLGGICANMAVALQADRLAHRVRLKTMSKFYSHVLSLPISFHTQTHSGEVMKSLLSGTDTLFGLWLGFFREQLSTVVSVLVLLPLTLFMNWKMSVTLIILLVLFSTMTTLVIRRTEARQKRTEKFHSTLASTAHDALSNVLVVKAFTQLESERRIFSNLASQVIATQFPVLNWWAFINVMTRASSTIAIVSIVIIGTILHVQGGTSVGEIVSFMGFAGLLIGRMESMIFFASRLFFQVPIIDDFFTIIDTKSSVPENPNAHMLNVEQGDVRFDNVCFSYPGGPPILSDLNFQAKKGTVVALVGQTGAGKSTAMNLLQRLWDPTQGSVLIDEHDIRTVSVESVHNAIGIVFQESFLFNRSIRENLLIGKPDATDEQIEQACKLAQAHDFIVKQPQGYDTMVGERGSTLSGGQRQRLAIARALIKNSPILILDEATSALDAATESKVSLALKALMQGRTTFIIAHRLSTVRDADQILVFENGTIVEKGNFEQLVLLKGKFAELVESQLLSVNIPEKAKNIENKDEEAS